MIDPEIVLYLFGGICGMLMLVAVVALLVEHLRKTRERQMSHLERMKALEMGQPLADTAIVRANADATRARALATIGVLVPLFKAGAAAGGTALVYFWTNGASQPLLYVIWGVAGLVSLVTVTTCLPLIARVRRGGDFENQPEAGSPDVTQTTTQRNAP